MMLDIRDRFLEFVKSDELFDDFDFSYAETCMVDDDSRYDRIDRYVFSFMSSDQLLKIMKFSQRNLGKMDIYLAFGQLCIGYSCENGGNQKRLPAFGGDHID